MSVRKLKISKNFQGCFTVQLSVFNMLKAACLLACKSFVLCVARGDLIIIAPGLVFVNTIFQLFLIFFFFYFLLLLKKRREAA